MNNSTEQGPFMLKATLRSREDMLAHLKAFISGTILDNEFYPKLLLIAGKKMSAEAVIMQYLAAMLAFDPSFFQLPLGIRARYKLGSKDVFRAMIEDQEAADAVNNAYIELMKFIGQHGAGPVRSGFIPVTR